MNGTMTERAWHDHIVPKGENGAPDLLYIDLHLMHEVTSPQAFEGLRLAGHQVRRPDLTIATEDHSAPTINIDQPVADITSRTQIDTLRENAEEFGVCLHSLGDADQGIVHMVGLQLGPIQPGMTIVYSDSHISAHGAFGTLAFNIDTSQVEHVLATQTLPMTPFKTMAITVNGSLPEGSTAKDIILAVIAKIGTGGGQSYIPEYRGQAIHELSMEGRMTVCNMSIEAGARANMIAPDQTTFNYIKDHPHAPEGEDWDRAVKYWSSLASDESTIFDVEVILETADIEPSVTWNTNPGQGVPPFATVSAPEGFTNETAHTAAGRVLECMDLKAGTPIHNIIVNTVFVGSCTDGRIEDLRAAASIFKDHRKAEGAHVIVVPGSARVHLQAETGGLGKIFTEFDAKQRNASCSMCLGINPDTMNMRDHSTSISDRNFESRQGKGSHTHLVSPLIAAATAVRGALSSPAGL